MMKKLHAQLAARDAETGRLKKEARSNHKEYRDGYRAEHEQTLVDITKENKRLLELRRYVAHDASCPKRSVAAYICTCGLDTVLEQHRAALGEEE
jgi:hypothetical protein